MRTIYCNVVYFEQSACSYNVDYYGDLRVTRVPLSIYEDWPYHAYNKESWFNYIPYDILYVLQHTQLA